LLRPLAKSQAFAHALFAPLPFHRPSRLKRKLAVDLLAEAGIEPETPLPENRDVDKEKTEEPWHLTLSRVWDGLVKHTQSSGTGKGVAFSSVEDAIEWAREYSHDLDDDDGGKLAGALPVLVTGSLYLVGNVLELMTPK
jgi:hypothetical protein